MRSSSLITPRALGMIAALAFAPLAASGQTFLIDFNTTATSGGYPGGAAAWNAYAAPANVTGTIKDSTGAASTISIGLSATGVGTIGPSDSTQGTQIDANVGGPSWLTTGPGYTDTQAGDYFFSSNEGSGDDALIVTFSGLTPGAIVSVDLWMGRISGQGGDGRFTYSLNGGTTTAGFNVLEKNGAAAGDIWAGTNTKDTTFRAFDDGRNLGRYMSITGLTVDSGGNLIITAADAPGSSYTGIAAIQLTVSNIPEPTTYAALLGVGALGLCAMRRRR